MKFYVTKKSNICHQNPNLYLSESSIYKRGVFCKSPLRKGDIIEKCPLILFKNEEAQWVKNTCLFYYYFITKQSPFEVALAMGYGSIYNHQYPCNAAFSFIENASVLLIKALKNIEPGTEITINYNGDPKDATPVIFQHEIPIPERNKK
jgi:SET domain-containing protein